MEKTVQTIPFLRLLIALISGIIIGSLIDFPKLILLLTLVIFVFLLIVLNQFYRYQFTTLFGWNINLVFICFGIFIVNTYNKTPVFYENGKFLATILEAPQEKQNSYKSVIKIDAFFRNDSTFKTSETTLVYFSKSSKTKQLNPGDIIIFFQNPQMVENKGNPFEFDYRNYLAQKKIYRQVYLLPEKWNKTSLKNSGSLLILAEKSREKLLNIYRSQNLGENEFEILSALTLGYKRELDPEIKQVFSSAGAMHILAVSGLHVGIIYWILSFLLGFLKTRKYGIILFVGASISGLWIFAFITGLSPSVMRAATMFSFVVFGTAIKRQSNIYNTLAASAFILLLINPNNLFDVGFQLSYSAVFGIVFLQPKFEKLIEVKSRFFNYFWILLTVSFAAQIATFPISIFYFNQFPTYFWITNLFVIPAVFILIPLGILLLLFSGIPAIAGGIAFILKNTISVVYLLLKMIENLPFSTQQITIQPLELIFIFFMLFSFFLLLKKHKIFYLKSILFFLIFILTISFIQKTKTKNRNQFIVYNNSQNLIIHLISGKKNYIISEKKFAENSYDLTIINNTRIKLNLHQPLFLTSENYFEDDCLFLKNKVIFFQNKLIITDKSTPKLPNKFTPDFIINPPQKEKLKSVNTEKTMLISNKKIYSIKTDHLFPVYFVQNTGAFQVKW